MSKHTEIPTVCLLLTFLSLALAQESPPLVVATGFDMDGSVSDVELVPLSPDDIILCSKPADFPFEIRGAAAELVDGKITICGGGYFLVFTNECHQYEPDSNVWVLHSLMNEIRSGAGGVNSPFGFWVSGGYDGGPIKSSTEILDSTGVWIEGPELPIALWDHCVINLSDNRTLVTGGYSSEEIPAVRNTWIYDWNIADWIQQGDLIDGRDDHFCSLLPDGRVIVAGGIGEGNTYLDSVEIFDPNTGEWTAGPPMPNNRWGGKAVINDAGETILVAGRTDLTFTENLWRYTGDGWEDLGVNLVTPRSYTVALRVPEQSLNGC